MFILIVPMFSVTRLNHDSNYSIISQTVPKIIEQRPDWQFDMVWPSNHSDWEYYADGFFDHPNIRRLPMHMHRHKMRQVGTFDVRGWDRYIGYKDNIYDVVWNNAPEIGAHLKYYETHYDHSGKSAVLNVHHFVMHESLPYPIDIGYLHHKRLQLHGATCVDVNLVHSDHCRAMLMENLTEYLNPDIVAATEATIRQFSLGTLRPDDYSGPKRRAKDSKTIFMWNHRWQNYKGWAAVMEMFDDIWQNERQDFEVRYTGAHSGKIDHYPWITHVGADSRDQYLANLREGHVNITNSRHETFCLSAVESMMFGQPLIAPNGVTFPEITGKTTTNPDYPYLFDTPAEMRALVIRAMDDPGEVKRLGAELRTFALDHYTADITAASLIDLFEEMGKYPVADQAKRIKDWKALLASRETWPMNELRQAAYRGVSSQGTRLAADQSWPTVKIKRLANELGWTDHRDSRGDLVLESP